MPKPLNPIAPKTKPAKLPVMTVAKAAKAPAAAKPKTASKMAAQAIGLARKF